MEVSRVKDRIHEQPLGRQGGYPYSSTAEIFHSSKLFLHSEIVEPGRSTSAPHFHRSSDEAVYVLSGRLVAIENGEEIEVGPGDSVLFSANSEMRHHLENRGTEGARYLLIRSGCEGGDVVY